MADVFLSYAREDKPAVSRLAAQLEAAGFTVWWDHNLAGGARYLKTTETELKASRAVVVCWSAASIESHWVADEASIGRDEQRLVPISLDGSQAPLGFRQFQVIDFTRWGHGDAKALPRLLAALEPLVKGAPSAPETLLSGRGEVGGRIGKHGRTIIGGLAFVAVLALAAALWSRIGPAARPGPTSPTVAVLPFEDLGGAPQTASLARDSPRVVADLLAQYGEQVVPAARSLAVTNATRATAARDLSAGYLVEGDVRMGAAKVLVLTLRLSDSRGRTIWTRPFQAQAAEADYLPEQAATLLAVVLSQKATFSRPGFTVADDRQNFRNERPLENYLQTQRSAAANPDDAKQVLLEVNDGAEALAAFPPDQRAALLDRLRGELERAKDLAPADSPLNFHYSEFLLTPEGDWTARDKLGAVNMAFNPPNFLALAIMGNLLAQEGRPAEAVSFSEQSVTVAPLSSRRLGEVGAKYLTAGRYQEAVEKMEQAGRRWPDQPRIPRVRFVAYLLLGQTKEAGGLLANLRLRDLIDPPAEVRPAALFLRAVETRRPADVKALADGCSRADRLSDPSLSMCLYALNAVGRIDDAYHLADQIYPDLRGATPKEREAKWLRNPQVLFNHGKTLFAVATAPMRQDRRFIALVERLGLVDYWRSSGRWPDFCAAEPRSVCPELKAMRSP